MTNKNAIIRYLAICYRLRKKPRPTLFDLKEACEERLSGLTIDIRTVQNDLFEMRYCQGLRFEAPIVYSKADKTYSYSDPDYSITKKLLENENQNNSRERQQ